MRKIILLASLLFLIPLVLAGTLEREFSSAGIEVGEEVEVNLIVEVNSDDNVYAIEEILPSGYDLIDNGGGSLSNNKLRWLKYSNLENITYTYKVKFSSLGTKTFLGKYAFNDEGEKTIQGYTEIIVTSDSGNGNGDGDGGNGNGGYTLPPTCTPSWSCGSWSQCADGIKVRTCTDLNGCGIISGKPEESMECEEAETIGLGGGEEKRGTGLFIGIVVGLIVLALIVIVLIIVLSRAKRKSVGESRKIEVTR